MKIELKNISYYKNITNGVLGFDADLHINDKKAGTTTNRIEGQATEYHSDTREGQQLIGQAENYCKGLLPGHFSVLNRDFYYEMSLAAYIEYLANAAFEEKESLYRPLRQNRDMDHSILVGSDLQRPYGRWELDCRIDLLLMRQDGKEALARILAENIAPQLGENTRILNTNIPVSIFEKAGIKEGQYVKQALEQEQNKQGKRQKL